MIYRLCCIRQSRCEWRAAAAIPRMSAPRHGVSPIVPMAQPPPSCSWPDYPISAQPIVWFSGHPTVASQQHMAKTLEDFRDGRFFAAPGFWSPPRPTRHSTLAGLPPPAIATTTVAPPLPPREHNAVSHRTAMSHCLHPPREAFHPSSLLHPRPHHFRDTCLGAAATPRS
ncbi:hypothetical protein CPAR01_00755 [Colletotrichum paranaense]|uniref:Uncharacterized protein n=1 Tax=Colletotrichum paranaense TaxID=1914294 RepID=A0ABQ9T4R9_9PEZI|nr:uncharacterized protein CPAR01_00755 [Colletotrichum paranaense]KAK1546788.1 hypothetical protein CPAR01_00755 [Colletotrichum paranaense]